MQGALFDRNFAFSVRCVLITLDCHVFDTEYLPFICTVYVRSRYACLELETYFFAGDKLFGDRTPVGTGVC